MSPEIYQQRRQRLLQRMSSGIAIIPTAPELIRNGGTGYPYRFDSSFYYLSGFNEPEAVLVLVAGEASQSILFCRDKDLEREIWDGFRYGPHAAKEVFGFDAAYSISQLDEQLTLLLANQPTVFYPLGADTNWDQRILKLRHNVQAKVRSGISAPDSLQDIQALIHEMRLFKDEHELSIMRQAATISAAAHQRAMRFTRPGQFEYQVEAEIWHHCISQGARFQAYGSIVAGGANACVLHYVDNNQILKDGDLLLIDAGCELDGYASDITRSFPINGRFSPAQRDVYSMVLAAQAAAIEAARPGNHWNSPHEAALKVLAQGLIDLKLCSGSVDSVLETEAYKPYYMHRTGHWLGLDVHDVGQYKTGQQWRELLPNMVLTVEPGCYIRPAEHIPRELWNIGIRIEDDVRISHDGHEILSHAAPKQIAEIEALMQD